MTLRDLAVFDLDGTLISGDSFRDLLASVAWTQPQVIVAGFGRKAGLLDRTRFAEIAHRCALTHLSQAEKLEAFVGGIAAGVLPDRARRITEWKERGATTLLLSSSPNEYIAPLGERLGFDSAHGSYWTEGRYHHLYGEGKARFLKERFPSRAWHWRYAIADAPADEHLLQLFEHAERV